MKQTTIKFRTWGGKRKGAGRKPKGEEAGVEHRRRSAFLKRTPVHVTLRVEEWVWNLRSRRAYFRVFEKAMIGGANRLGIRVVQFALMGNHAHLLIEADDSVALGRGVQGLAVRFARGMNGLMGRKGRVFADRFHSRALRTPTEVRQVAHYIRYNYKHHYGDGGDFDPFSSDNPEMDGLLPAARTWLVTKGQFLPARRPRARALGGGGAG